jgi:hypothetical protein
MTPSRPATASPGAWSCSTASKIAALRTTEVSCADGATRLKFGADWLNVPGPVAMLLRHQLHNRSNMATAANPASPWLFPGQLASEYRSYRRPLRVLHQLGIPARASRLAAWRELAVKHHPRSSPTRWASRRAAMRHAFLGGADWSAHAAREVLPPQTTGRGRTLLPVTGICPPGTRNCPEGPAP